MDGQNFDLSWLWGTLSALGTGVAGLIVGGRKARAEADKSEIESVNEAIKIWREIALELRGEMEKQAASYEAKVAALEKKIGELEAKLNGK